VIAAGGAPAAVPPDPELRPQRHGRRLIHRRLPRHRSFRRSGGGDCRNRVRRENLLRQLRSAPMSPMGSVCRAHGRFEARIATCIRDEIDMTKVAGPREVQGRIRKRYETKAHVHAFLESGVAGLRASRR